MLARTRTPGLPAQSAVSAAGSAGGASDPDPVTSRDLAELKVFVQAEPPQGTPAAMATSAVGSGSAGPPPGAGLSMEMADLLELRSAENEAWAATVRAVTTSSGVDLTDVFQSGQFEDKTLGEVFARAEAGAGSAPISATGSAPISGSAPPPPPPPPPAPEAAGSAPSSAAGSGHSILADDSQVTLEDGTVTIAFSSHGQQRMALHMPARDASRLVDMLTSALRIGSATPPASS